MTFNYQKNRAWSENLSIVLQLGLTMAGCIFFCFFVGRWLDQRLGFKGFFTVSGILFGVVGGAAVVYRQIMEVTASMTGEVSNKVIDEVRTDDTLAQEKDEHVDSR